jgi:hypothetical protein
MSAAKHTPGPWAIGMRTGHNGNTVYARNGETRCGNEAAVHHYDTGICNVFGMYQNTDAQEQPEGEAIANARLIAAAPDMVYALNLMLREHDALQMAIGSTEDRWPAATLARDILNRLGY